MESRICFSISDILFKIKNTIKVELNFFFCPNHSDIVICISNIGYCVLNINTCIKVNMFVFSTFSIIPNVKIWNNLVVTEVFNKVELVNNFAYIIICSGPYCRSCTGISIKFNTNGYNAICKAMSSMKFGSSITITCFLSIKNNSPVN